MENKESTALEIKKADAWMKKRENARLLFPAITSVLTGIFLFIAFTFLQGNIQYCVLLLIGITAVAFVPASVAVTQDVVHPGLHAVSLSLCIIIQILQKTCQQIFF